MCRVIYRGGLLGAALLVGALMLSQERVESAEPQYRTPDQSCGLLDRLGMHDLSARIDAPFNRVLCEPGDIPLAPWDRAPRTGGLCDRWHACHEEKKAWHYYIRGVGPAVHLRSPGRPCLW
jgi:hypothetical protein